MSDTDQTFTSFDYLDFNQISENQKDSEALQKTTEPLESEWNSWECSFFESDGFLDSTGGTTLQLLDEHPTTSLLPTNLLSQAENISAGTKVGFHYSCASFDDEIRHILAREEKGQDGSESLKLLHVDGKHEDKNTPHNNVGPENLDGTSIPLNFTSQPVSIPSLQVSGLDKKDDFLKPGKGMETYAATSGTSYQRESADQPSLVRFFEILHFSQQVHFQESTALHVSFLNKVSSSSQAESDVLVQSLPELEGCPKKTNKEQVLIEVEQFDPIARENVWIPGRVTENFENGKFKASLKDKYGDEWDDIFELDQYGVMWRFAPLEESDLPPVKPPSSPSSPAEIKSKEQDSMPMESMETKSSTIPKARKFSRKLKRNAGQKSGFGHRLCPDCNNIHHYRSPCDSVKVKQEKRKIKFTLPPSPSSTDVTFDNNEDFVTSNDSIHSVKIESQQSQNPSLGVTPFRKKLRWRTEVCEVGVSKAVRQSISFGDGNFCWMTRERRDWSGFVERIFGSTGDDSIQHPPSSSPEDKILLEGKLPAKRKLRT